MAPEPIAHGSLEQTPFAHVIVSIAQRGMEGTLAVWGETSGQDRLYFRDGQVVRARLLQPSADLVRGLLPLFRRTTTYAFYREDLVGPGQLEGAIDYRALLVAGLRGGVPDDAAEGVFARFAGQPLRLARGVDLAAYGFIAREQAFLDAFRAMPSTVAAAIGGAGHAKSATRVLYALAITRGLEVFEGSFERQSLTEMTQSGEGAPGRPSSAPGRSSAPQGTRSSAPATASTPATPSAGPPARSTATPATASATPATATAGPSTPATPSTPSTATPSTATPSTATPSAAPAAPRPRPATPQPTRASGDATPPAQNRQISSRIPRETDRYPAPRASLPPEAQERWQQVITKARTLDEQTYFQMLGVSHSANAESIRDAYFAQVKKWHPDRLPPDLAELRPLADEIFQHLTSAHETLSDVDERGKYLKTVQGGGGTPKADRELQRILGAAMEFQKVEVLIRRKEWDRAEALARELLEIVPNEADYHAALGLILWSSEGGKTEAALRSLDEALMLFEGHERALMTKARIFDRQGNKAGAVRLFEKVAKLYPKNVDAQRQVRLAKMRGLDTGSHAALEDDKSKKSDTGIFGKLFGGKK